MGDLDLTTVEGVRAYLVGTEWASTEVVELSGGTANYVYRVRLVTPFKGKEMVVVKHAKPYVKDWQTLAFGLERQVYEVEALRRVGAWLDADSVVRVPEVHLFDEEEHVIIMDDAGERAVSLKTLVKEGRASVELSKQIGKAIGGFLGKMHRWGHGNKALCDAIKGNEQAKKMSSWAFYERLEETVSAASTVTKLMDPPLGVPESDLEVIRAVAVETTQTLMDAQDYFVMGDFWPGNVLVLAENGVLKQIMVLDWELAKTGLAGVDVGQFCAEIHMLRRWEAGVCAETAGAVLDEFLASYGRNEETARRAVVHWGVHMAVLGARVDWGDKAASRALVLEGVRIIVDQPFYYVAELF